MFNVEKLKYNIYKQISWLFLQVSVAVLLKNTLWLMK